MLVQLGGRRIHAHLEDRLAELGLVELAASVLVPLLHHVANLHVLRDDLLANLGFDCLAETFASRLGQPQLRLLVRSHCLGHLLDEGRLFSQLLRLGAQRSGLADGADRQVKQLDECELHLLEIERAASVAVHRHEEGIDFVVFRLNVQLAPHQSAHFHLADVTIAILVPRAHEVRHPIQLLVLLLFEDRLLDGIISQVGIQLLDERGAKLPAKCARVNAGCLPVDSCGFP